jgi:hypothetical protein
MKFHGTLVSGSSDDAHPHAVCMNGVGWHLPKRKNTFICEFATISHESTTA